MKQRILKSAVAAGLATLPVATAYAHNGDHGEHIVATIIHWLSSPTHSLFAVIGGVIASALIIRMVRKKRA